MRPSQHFLAALAVLSLAASPMAKAQNAQPSLTVQTIDIQYAGPATISKERILANMRTAVGRPYSDLAVEEDIRNLYATGNISNVRIFGEPESGGGVRVVVVVQTRAAIKEILFEGAEAVNPKKLRKKIESKPGEQLSEAKLEADRHTILEYYRDRNFLDTQVDYTVSTDEATNQAIVTFNIAESLKTTINRIDFEGNTVFTERQLRKIIVTRKKTLISFLTKAGRIKDGQIETDINNLTEHYKSEGYLDVVVGEPRLERIDNTAKVNMIYPITEGPQFHVGTVAVTGTEVVKPEELTEHFHLKPGGVYSPQKLDADLKTIRDTYGSRGYVDVQVYPEINATEPTTENVNFIVEEGIQSYVQMVNISGNNRTKDKVIRRELALAPGDIYNTVRSDASKNRLTNLNYFERVDIYPSDTMLPGRKDLNVVVTEKRTGSLNFGAGFSSIDSLLGFVEITQSNFDITNWPRFSGGGQRFRARIQYGTKRKDFVLSLTEPYFLDYQLAVGGELFYHDADFMSTVYSQRNYGFSLFTRKAINQFMSWRLDYRLENITIYDVDNTASNLIKSQAGSLLKSQISPSLVYDSRDSVFLTRKGTRAQLTTYLAGGFLGGDVQTYGLNLEAAHYILLPWDTILTFNGEVGVVDTWGSGKDVPIFDRLYLGGSNNLRGFRFRDVSPLDENYDPIGGSTLARLTVEYTFPVVDRVRGAVFYDTGFVNAGAYDFSFDHMASDVGIGIRLDLPIGPVRIDYGIPMQKGYDDRNKSGRFNFNIGYQF
ncbi:MAG TPA: outer membrane protein assembly factor BamA [Chthoniobacteraceae bacterium]|nr:outer membrane protein assembly factor BamA [Chthoniobacteraceae bacterium]